MCISAQKIFFVFFFGVLLLSYSSFAKAQNSPSGQATEVSILGSNSQNGSIVSLTNKGYELSTVIYDNSIVGVVNTDPDIVYKYITVENNPVPLTVSGETYILVSNSPDLIKTGDYITSSSVAGVGQKALTDGMVVGRALEDAVYGPQNTALVFAQVAPQIYMQSPGSSAQGLTRKIINALSALVVSSESAASKEPSKTFRYLLSVIAVVLSVVFGFLIFGRVALRGLEALGRNPMAGKVITFGIVINATLTILITLLGLVLSYFLITL